MYQDLFTEEELGGDMRGSNGILRIPSLHTRHKSQT